MQNCSKNRLRIGDKSDKRIYKLQKNQETRDKGSNRLKSNKALESDQKPAEVLKTSTTVAADLLYDLLKSVWNSKQMATE